MKLLPGTLFARDFRVVSALAEGGMGALYAVEQLSTGKRRALKVMQPQLIPDARARERFVLEARIGSQIESEHVVDVVASGIDEPTGMPWIAMELLEGVDLADYVKARGCLTPAETYEVLSQLSDGLGAAHARGIVHRDLKPENVFIATSKRRGVPFLVKILDFGIAKVTHENQTSATGTSAMGSPLWMAPEQTESGTRLRPSTDVWALGLMTFWMLTGRSYWRAGNQNDIALTPIFTEVLVLALDPPSVRAAQLGMGHLVPATFDPWFFRCVARNHDLRFVDATQAMAALTPQFSMVEASSARRMIPATVAMPSVPPGVFPSSAAMTTPVPQTTAHPPIEPPSSPHIYLPQPTEQTPGLANAASAAVMPYGPTSFLPSSHSPAGPQSQGAPLLGSTAPMHPADGGWAPTQLAHMAGPAAVSAHASMQASPASHGGGAVSVQPASFRGEAGPRGSAGGLRWVVLAAALAFLGVGTLGAAGLAIFLFGPGPGPEPPPLASFPDAAVARPDAGTDAYTLVEDTGLDAPAVRARPLGGGAAIGTHDEVVGPDPNPGARGDVFPDGSDRRFVGSWAGEGWRYRLIIDLARDGASVAGTIRWTLAETPDPMYTARIGEMATEQVRGQFAPPGLITLDGQSVSDDSLISADHYDLHLAEDGTIVGTAREGGGRLSARAIE